MSLSLLFEAIKERQRQRDRDIYAQKEKEEKENAPVLSASQKPQFSEKFVKSTTLFYNEFRFVIVTALLVVASLNLQTTVQRAIDYYIQRHLPQGGRRLVFQFLVSLVLVIIVIGIFLIWKPIRNPIENNSQ